MLDINIETNEKKMCTALNTSKYILKYCELNKIPDCSNKKLQKLLYYVQAWSLALRNKPMFKENIEAWIHGPVVPVIYRKYKNFGYKPISGVNLDICDGCITKDDEELIDAVMDIYSKYDADSLELFSHEDLPWQEARRTNDKVISLESMKSFYKNILKNAKKQA